MLCLRADYAKNLDCNYSVFITFKYNPNYVSLIKTLKNRSWNSITKEWEIGQDSYNDLLNLIKQYNISYNEKEFRASIDTLKFKVAKSQEQVKKEETINTEFVDSYNFKTIPRDYQLEGIKFGIQNNCYLNADTMGLGKSLQCINTAILKKGGKHCLVITGYSTLQFNWVNEIRKHSNENAYILGQRIGKRSGKINKGCTEDIIEDIKNIDSIKEFFLITSISTIRHCIKTDSKVDFDKKGKPKKIKKYDVAELLEELCKDGTIGRIILDEAHVIKGFTTDQSEAMLKLKSSPYKIAATGTPIMNNNIEIYPILKWLNRTSLNYYQFRDKYCIMGGFKNKQIVGNKNGDQLNQYLSTFMLRRNKDILSLPPKIIIDEYLEMDLKQESLYNQTRARIMQQMKKGNRNAILQLFTELRKISDNPAWVNDKYTESVKFERVLQLVNEIIINNEKVIIFSNWATPIADLYSKLSTYNPIVIDGSVSLYDRDLLIKKFQEDESCKIIMGTVGALGVGVTLTAARNIIFVDEPWNKALKEQYEDRAHRIGTKGSVNIYTLLCKNTLDEKVHRMIFEKGLVAEVAIDGMSIEQMQKLLEEEDGNKGN